MKILAHNFNQVLTDILPYFELTDDIDEAEKVVLWQDEVLIGRSVAKLAISKRKPVIVVQHGAGACGERSKYYPPFNIELLANKICVWGEDAKNGLLGLGISPKRIEVTGTTVLKHLKPRVKHKGVNIVFCPAHWCAGEIDENKQVAKILRKIKGVNITTKIIEGHNPSYYDNPVFSYRSSPDHLEICADVLSKADLVVGLTEGTFELMAMVLDIPIVMADIWKPKICMGDMRYLNIKQTYTIGSKKVQDLSKLEQVIRQQLKNPDEFKEKRKQVTIIEGGVNIENPLERIVDVIKNA